MKILGFSFLVLILSSFPGYAEQKSNLSMTIESGKRITYQGKVLSLGSHFNKWKQAIGKARCILKYDATPHFCAWDKLGLSVDFYDSGEHEKKWLVRAMNIKINPLPEDSVTTAFNLLGMHVKSTFNGSVSISGIDLNSQTKLSDLRKRLDPDKLVLSVPPEWRLKLMERIGVHGPIEDGYVFMWLEGSTDDAKIYELSLSP